MHRYDADTVGRVRTDYLHRAQKYVETAMQSAQYTIDNATSASEKSKATKAVTKYTKQLAEMKIYDEAIAHVANQRIEIDLDDGVKVNYAKFQGVEVAQEGKKALKVDLLAKIREKEWGELKMKIKKLTLNNFMAFENAEINWSDNINIICGENSTGKTTLLKVMYSLIKPLSSGGKENLTKEMEEQAFVKKIQGVFRPEK